MKNNHVNNLFVFVLIGLTFGSLIGSLGYFGILSRDRYDTLSNFTIIICIGLIITIIDLLFFRAIIYRIIINNIEKNGTTTSGKIEEISIIPHPSQLYADEWTKKSRYVLKVSYKAGLKTYKKEFPPTALVSKQELYPVLLEKGSIIELKYSKKRPSFCIIDIDALKEESDLKAKISNAFLLIIPLIITITYLFVLFNSF